MALNRRVPLTTKTKQLMEQSGFRLQKPDRQEAVTTGSTSMLPSLSGNAMYVVGALGVAAAVWYFKFRKPGGLSGGLGCACY